MSGDVPDLTSKMLASYFDLEPEDATELSSHLKVLTLEGGDALFNQGDYGDSLYILVRGRLQVWLDQSPPVYIGEILPGESVGEVALLTGEARSASVRAVRYSEMVKVDRELFEELASKYPAMVLRLASMVAKRLHDNTTRSNRRSRPVKVICLRPLNSSPRLEKMCDEIAAQLREHGSVLELHPGMLARSDIPGAPKNKIGSLSDEFRHWLDAQEELYQYVVLRCEPDDSPWSDFARKQSDLLLLIAESDSGSELRDFEKRICRGHLQRHALVLVHCSSKKISGTKKWLEKRDLDFHLHLREGVSEDLERIARILTGKANGLVLGGGAARGFSHLGVYKALSESNIPIDWIGGTSIGAIMGVSIAIYIDPDTAIEAARQAFVVGRPFDDFTLPIVSLLSGNRMNRLSEKFMPGEIEDLIIPFFAISSNINTGEINVHEQGVIWKATSASAALPGVFPPMIYQSSLAVDGAVLNNLPVDVMQGKPVGTIFAVELSSREQNALGFSEIPSPWRLMLNRLLPFKRAVDMPGLATLMLKATEVANRKRTFEIGSRADYLFQPPVQGFSLLKVDHFDEVVAVGYEHARTMIQSWQLGESSADEVPVSEMIGAET